jgi:murein DD-endopeptidase MepM/ murein hydrolase activator NlpD
MVKLSSLLIVVGLIYSQISPCAIKSIAKVDLEINKYKTELSSHRNNLLKLKREILSLKENVSGQTSKFSKIISIKTNLKEEINEQRKQLTIEEKKLVTEVKVLKKIFAGIILTEDTENEVDYRYLTLKSLKTKENTLKKRRAAILAMTASVKKMETELQEYDFIESDLISNIERMHKKEKMLRSSMEGVNDNITNGNLDLNKLSTQKKSLIRKQKRNKEKKRLAKIKKLERKRLAEKKINQIQEHEKRKIVQSSAKRIEHIDDFILPLKEFDRIQKDKAGGISLFVSSGKEILAPKSGEVIYTGKLSTYGNVIVLKHEGQYQSVILGDIISNVSKRDFVQKGQVIGNIIENNGDAKKLYYELRNKSKKVSYNKLFKGISI